MTLHISDPLLEIKLNIKFLNLTLNLRFHISREPSSLSKPW